LAVAEGAIARVPAELPSGVGRAASAPVAVALARPSSLRCTLDERWAAGAGPAHAAVALAEALAAARAELGVAAAARASATASLDGLLTAIIDHIDALNGRP
jgi:hypothetical protein